MCAAPNLWTACASLLAAVACAISASTASADSRGRAVASSLSYDFGTVTEGEKVAHNFVIRNSGSGPLSIIGTSPSCGCTVAAISKPALEPGQSAEIRVQFDTSGFSGPKAKVVEVFTSDKSSPSISLTMKGTVAPGVVIEPQALQFGRLSSQGALAERQKLVTISIPAKSSATIKSVHSDSGLIELAQRSQSEREASYLVTLKEGAPRGPFRDRIVVEFAGSTMDPVNIPVVAMIEGDIILKPSTVSFGVVTGQAPLERRVSFSYRAKDPLTINYVSSSDPAVSAYYQGGGKGMDGTIVIRLNPAKVKGDLKATIEISTNHPSDPVARLNVLATIPPA